MWLHRQGNPNGRNGLIESLMKRHSMRLTRRELVDDRGGGLDMSLQYLQYYRDGRVPPPIERFSRWDGGVRSMPGS